MYFDLVKHEESEKEEEEEEEEEEGDVSKFSLRMRAKPSKHDGLVYQTRTGFVYCYNKRPVVSEPCYTATFASYCCCLKCNNKFGRGTYRIVQC